MRAVQMIGPGLDAAAGAVTGPATTQFRSQSRDAATAFALLWCLRVALQDEFAALDIGVRSFSRLGILGLAGCLVALPSLIVPLLERRGVRPAFANDGAVSVATVFLITLLGLAPGLFGLSAAPLGVVVVATGLLALAAGLWRGVRGVFSLRALPLVLLSLWAWPHHGAVPPEIALATNGQVHQDEVFYASLVSMIRTFGYPSTGLDGVHFANYHTGSFVLGAAMGNLLDIHSFAVVSVGMRLLFLGFFIARALQLTATMAAALVERPSVPVKSPEPMPQGPPLFLRSMGHQPWVWWVFCLASCGAVVFPLPVLFMGSNEFMRNSPSYSLAVGLLLAGVHALVIDAWPRGAVAGTVSPSVSGLVVLVVSWAAAASCKMSLPFVALPGLAWLCLRSGLVRRPRAWLTLAAVGAICALCLRYLTPHLSASLPRMAFALFRHQEVWAILPGLLYREWLPILLTSLALLPLWGTPGAILRAVRGRRLLDVEIVWVMAIVGMVPPLIIDHHDASYFSDLVLWVALPFALARLAAMGVEAGAGRDRRLNDAHGGDNSRPSRAALVVRTIAVVALLSSCANIVWGWSQAVNAVLVRRGFPLPEVFDTRHALLRGQLGVVRARLQAKRNEAAAALADARRVVPTLLRLGERPCHERAESLLYVPRDNSAYWGLLAEPDAAAGYLGPALAGSPMLDGLPPLPPPARALPVGYLLSDYGYPDAVRAIPARRSDGELVRRAASLGFLRVLVLEPEADGVHVRIRPLEVRGFVDRSK